MLTRPVHRSSPSACGAEPVAEPGELRAAPPPSAEEGRKGPRANADRAVLEAFLADPANAVLVSFPRTGSHWLRMLIELYFERPLLNLTFHHRDRTDYLLYHTHDLDLTLQRQNVLYLYRDPVPTVYSQLVYHREDLADETRVRHWASLYGAHLDKWLFLERDAHRKTILRYERLLADPWSEFVNVVRHFGADEVRERFDEIVARASKDEIARRTTHDPKVIASGAEYERRRRQFFAAFREAVWEAVLDGRPEVLTAFPEELARRGGTDHHATCADREHTA